MSKRKKKRRNSVNNIDQNNNINDSQNVVAEEENTETAEEEVEVEEAEEVEAASEENTETAEEEIVEIKEVEEVEAASEEKTEAAEEEIKEVEKVETASEEKIEEAKEVEAASEEKAEAVEGKSIPEPVQQTQNQQTQNQQMQNQQMQNQQVQNQQMQNQQMQNQQMQNQQMQYQQMQYQQMQYQQMPGQQMQYQQVPYQMPGQQIPYQMPDQQMQQQNYYVHENSHPGKAAKKEKKKKLHYTVLLIPNNAHRVRQFKLSFDVLIGVFAIFAILVFGVVFYVSSTVLSSYDLEEIIATQSIENDELRNENTILQANVEELEAALHEAKVTIDTSAAIKQQEDVKKLENTKPTSFPIDNASSLPSEYTEETKYVEFMTGMGTKVIATADGVVSDVTADREHGNVVVVDHGNTYQTVYMIPSTPVVSKGDKVVRGSTLFVVEGDNEKLAYQVLLNDVSIDPMTILEVNG